MLEEEVAQGRSILARMEAELPLTEYERESLPSHRRVSVIEAQNWQDALERKLNAFFGADTLRRYQTIWDVHRNERERGSATELERFISTYHRIVDLLDELDARPSALRQTWVTDGDAPSDEATRTDDIYDVFISHAWEDKEAVARPLAMELSKGGARVWFDEATLQLGDSLRRKIDEGLARCRFGVVILSPSFLRKEWPQRELDGLIARETSTGEKAILPVWHNIDGRELTRYSPTLADRLAARSTEGAMAIAEQILRLLPRKA